MERARELTSRRAEMPVCIHADVPVDKSRAGRAATQLRFRIQSFHKKPFPATRAILSNANSRGIATTSLQRERFNTLRNNALKGFPTINVEKVFLLGTDTVIVSTLFWKACIGLFKICALLSCTLWLHVVTKGDRS